MFSLFLFAVVFSFYCWLAYESQQMSDQQQRLEFAVTRTAPPLQSTVAEPVLLVNKSEALEILSTVALTLNLTFETEAHTAVPVTELSTQLFSTLALELNTALVPEMRTQVAPEILAKESIKEPCTTIAADKKLVLDSITALKIRNARKVASALDIKQKTNGKDKPLNWLQKELMQKLESHQEQLTRALQLANLG